MNLDNVINTLKEIWNDRHMDNRTTLRLLRLQLKEIESCGYTNESAFREFLDVINICIEWYSKCGFDNKRIINALITRANDRYKGNQKEIESKYRKLLSE